MAMSGLFVEQGVTVDLSHNGLSDSSADTLNNLNLNVERSVLQSFTLMSTY